MIYYPNQKNQELLKVPIKSCCVPRPIAWVSTISKDGIPNLAPYSQFQNLTFDPYYVMISINQNHNGRRKDTTVNIEETGEFVCGMVPYHMSQEMNITASPFNSEIDEFEAAGIKKIKSNSVKPYSIEGSPVQIECRYTQTLRLPGKGTHGTVDIIIGEAISIYIDDNYIGSDNKIDIARIKPLARLGYSDYTYVDKVFEILPSDKACSVEDALKGLVGASDSSL
ncbi:MAG: flavin reductase family protein [Synergistaceae bacterium]|jgi:flavin reductase (DIM6/NTAB) family NADH-FMN oxidoreductase RutF|nr:flavin reductase family protein [Synergistaceae bacterium]